MGKLYWFVVDVKTKSCIPDIETMSYRDQKQNKSCIVIISTFSTYSVLINQTIYIYIY